MIQMIVNGVVLLLVFGVTISFASQTSRIHGLHRLRRQTQVAEKAGCRLPPPQQNGTFSPSKRRCPPDNDIALCRMTPGNLVPHNWPLFHSCDPGFALNTSKTVSVCVEGQWKPAIPSCIRLCPPLTSTAGKLKCVLGSQDVSCENDAKPGTVAKAECPRYHRSSLEMKCQDDGNWADSRSDHMKTQMFPESEKQNFFHCVPECGLSSKVGEDGANTKTSVATEVSSSIKYPWVAGIYGKLQSDQNGNYRLLCVGTLISTFHVLTAAHCVQNNKPEDFRVGLGKINSTFYKVESSSVILEVEKAVIHELYNSSVYRMDIAVLRLLLEAQVSSSIMPVCTDWSHIYKPESNATLTVTGWSRTRWTETQSYVTENITPGVVRYVSNEECLKTLSGFVKSLLFPEKSCAEDVDGYLYNGVSGTATTVQVEGRHFLIGYLASKLTHENRTFMMIVDATVPLISQWIEKNLKTGSDCPEGHWDPALPGCIRLCRPLTSTEVKLKCTLGSQEVSCENDAKPGTVAKAECPRYHRSSLEMKCQDDGNWTDSRSEHTKTQLYLESGNLTVFQCVPECGMSSKVDPIATVISSPSEYPWVAGMYAKREGKYQLFCVGTLVSSYHVLTAAHCLQDKKPEDIRVGLGKINSDFYHVESSSVILEVEKAVIHESYEKSIYIMDIALLRLLLKVQVTSSVMPVCMDWRHIYKPESNTTLTVSGWSRTEDRRFTEIVTPGLVRYVEHKDCLRTLSETYKAFLAPEKSCAEDVDGNLYNGISGTPTTLQVEGRHFVIGFLASKITNNGNPLMMIVDTTFQSIYQWIEENLKENKTQTI